MLLQNEFLSIISYSNIVWFLQEETGKTWFTAKCRLFIERKIIQTTSNKMDLAETVRSEFPAIVECSDYVFGDAPTGTQCHRSVSQAMHDYMNRPGAHLMGHYPGALNTQNATTKARVAAAAFFNAKPEEVGWSVCERSFNHSSVTCKRQFGL